MPTYARSVDFRRLPKDVQNRLIELQSDGEDRLMFPSKVSWLWLAPIALAFGWLLYIYSAVSQPLWENWMLWLVSGISLVVFPVAWYAAVKFVGPRFSSLKNGHLFTTDELFYINRNRIEVSSLKVVDSLRFKEHDNEIEIWQGGSEEKISEPDIVNARHLHRVFDDWKKEAGEGLIGSLAESEADYDRTRSFAFSAAGLVIAGLVGVSIAAGSVKLNQYLDDEDTWARAQAANSIDQYDAYKIRHPNGRHLADANVSIAAQISKLRDDYAARAAKSASPEAVNAMTSLISDAITRPDRTIFLKVTEDRKLDEAVVEQIHQELGTFVQGYESSVPTNAVGFRQNKVFSDLKVMMNGAFTTGGLKMELVDELPQGAPSIEINLMIRPEKFFYRTSSLVDGRIRNDIYAVANFNFQANVRPAAQSPYHFEYVGQPMQLSPAFYDRRDKDNYTFDKVYFGAVTDGFDRTWARTFGFSEILTGVD